jgi:hypothetical protein
MGLGFISAFFLDRIFRSIPNPNKPNRIIAIFGLAWMVPINFYQILIYLYNPVAFGYIVQQVINSPVERGRFTKLIISALITVGIIMFISVRIYQGVN